MTPLAGHLPKKLNARAVSTTTLFDYRGTQNQSNSLLYSMEQSLRSGKECIFVKSKFVFSRDLTENKAV